MPPAAHFFEKKCVKKLSRKRVKVQPFCFNKIVGILTLASLLSCCKSILRRLLTSTWLNFAFR